jgi:hypothetical protein
MILGRVGAAGDCAAAGGVQLWAAVSADSATAVPMSFRRLNMRCALAIRDAAPMRGRAPSLRIALAMRRHCRLGCSFWAIVPRSDAAATGRLNGAMSTSRDVSRKDVSSVTAEDCCGVWQSAFRPSATLTVAKRQEPTGPRRPRSPRRKPAIARTNLLTCDPVENALDRTAFAGAQSGLRPPCAGLCVKNCAGLWVKLQGYGWIQKTTTRRGWRPSARCRR